MAETVRWVTSECARHPNYVFQITNTPFPVDHQRNLQIQVFLRSGATHLFLLDSDEVPLPNTLEILLAEDVPVVAAPSYRGDGHLMMWDYIDGCFVYHQEVTDRQWVDGVGVSGLLLRRDVVEKLSPIRQLYTDDGFLSLDDSLAICKQLMGLGQKILVLCDLIQAHLKIVPLK